MSPSKPTKAEADRLVAARKVVSALVSWTSDHGRQGGWRVEAKALSTEPRAVFRLLGYIGPRNYSFTLLYNNYPIRKFTKHDRHRVCNKVFTEPHKHTWDEEKGDYHAYVPNNIDPTNDVNDQFLAFCEECNIRLVGGYQHILHGCVP